MIVKVSDKEYEISGSTNLGIDEVVEERAELIEMKTAELWTPYVLEVIDRRLSYLDSRIVDYFLKSYKRKK
jgi:hypothetical protein